MNEAQEVVRFWLEEVGRDGWYTANEDVDEKIRSNFGSLWERARDGALLDWCETPEGTLGYLILTDQFPRNMFRGDPRAFDTDAAARAVARTAVGRGQDLMIDEPQRVFFYMPFEHSEQMEDQDFAVDLISRNLPRTGEGFALHARAHREVILRFGRFPFRNEALGRVSSPDERAFLESGGYGAIVRALES
ncbi:DUF924 domain-containing protein [Defluviimonas sp. WL0002]|uniref:DUF924 domain-containing protein n=1 Tax=Albidovulum marisflavi TaxID=2984159 RepID=A0ABT2ZH66_9RHOB|nr:DUF924 family protein [Defluviimonas sp. WL0002]MCV2870462.1 DUF924 domain-containing protein [Defluviimonas sp. WL0002]